jgi:outer membrane protein assembly factor BamE (lipoprotein component of BamABCDE complex)
MTKHVFTIICSLILFSCAANNYSEDRLTLGTVQSHVSKGQNQTEILKKIGSPNIITKDAQGNEVWTYDRISKENTSKSAVGFLLFNPATWFGGGASSYDKSTSTSKSLIVIITFDENKNVLDFSYQSVKF